MADQHGAPQDLPTPGRDPHPSGHAPAEAHTETTNADERSFFSSLMAILGFIIIIVLVIWGLVHLISLAGNWFTTGQSANTIQVTAPGYAQSGEQFTVSWKYTPSRQGTYAFLYPCHQGLQFKTSGPDGSLYVVPCGAAYTMPVTNNSIALTPSLTSTSSIVTPLSVLFLPNATGTAMVQGEAQGSTTITITLPGNATSTSAGTPSSSGSTSKTSSGSSRPKATTYHSSTYTYNGPADLAVSDVSGSVDSSGNATVTFDIGNIGGSPTGSYYFSASLPTVSGVYTSPMQVSLNPGDHIVNTLSFGPVQGGGVFSVTIIPGGADSNAGNNSSSITLVGSYNGSYNYNNSYPTPATNYNYTIGGGYGYPYQNQPLYYTQNSQPYYNYPYNQYQPYQYQPTYTY